MGKNSILLFFIILGLLVNTELIASPDYPVDSLAEKLDRARKLLPQNPAEADSLAMHVLQAGEPAGIDSLIAKAYYTLGLSSYYAGNHILSAHYYEKALLENHSRQHPDFESALWNNLGINYEIQNKPAKAVDAYLRSLELAKQASDSVSIYQSYNNLGFLYIGLMDFATAEDYLNRALRFFLKANDDYNTALAYHNLAILNISLKNDDLVSDYFDRAVQFYRKSGTVQKVFEALVDKTNFLLEKGMTAAARSQLDTLRAFGKIHSNPYVQAITDVLYGTYYLNNQQLNLAGKHFQDAEAFFVQSQSNIKLADLYQSLGNLYLQQRNPDAYQETMQKHLALIKKTYAEESASKIAELRVLHKVEHQQQNLLFLNNQINQKNRIIRLWVALAFIFLLFATIVLIFFSKIKQKNRALYLRNIEQAKLLEQQLIENNQKIPEPKILHTNQDVTEEDLNQAFFTQLFQKVKKHIINEKRYLDPSLKISDVAYELGTNEKYVSQAFRIGVDENFNSFINYYRINQAKKLLSHPETSGLSIKEVAMKSGFNNQPHFQRKFKDLTGMTPNTFKKIGGSL